MSSELTILAIYGLVVIATILAQVLFARAQVGDAMLFTARDDMPKLTGAAGRMDRAQLNTVVALAMFAPAILLLNAKGGFTGGTLLASQLFLVARVLYVPTYAIGVSLLRTLIWLVGFGATAYLYYMAL
jgi:uncharacterized MAPEG superfamily protein